MINENEVEKIKKKYTTHMIFHLGTCDSKTIRNKKTINKRAQSISPRLPYKTHPNRPSPGTPW
jgi:hypothetical protein